MVSTAGHLFNCVSITYIEKESYWHNVSLVWEHKKNPKNINIILLFNKGSNQTGFYTCWPSSPHISDISQVLTVLTECRHPLPVIQHIILSPSTSLSTYSFVSSPFILILPFPVTCSHHSLFFILLLPSLPLIHHILLLPFSFSHFHIVFHLPFIPTYVFLMDICFREIAKTLPLNSPLWCCFYSLAHTQTHTHTRTRTCAHTHPHTHTHRKTCKNIKPERVVHTLSSPL